MKTTKSDLITRCAQMEREHEPMSLALSDLVNRAVTWFGAGEFCLGVSRVLGAHGGVVIAKRSGTISAHYWETWSREALEHIAACITGENNDHNRELLRHRDVIDQASQYIRNAQRAA